LRYVIPGIDCCRRKSLTVPVWKGRTIADEGEGGSEVKSRYRGEFKPIKLKTIR
jgi:hypothetical protein